MKPNQLEKWKKTRELGPWKYALIYGTIWALFVLSFVFIVNTFLKFDENLFTTKGLVFALAIYWVTGFILYRFIVWNSKEKIYKKYLKKQNNKD